MISEEPRKALTDALEDQLYLHAKKVGLMYDLAESIGLDGFDPDQFKVIRFAKYRDFPEFVCVATRNTVNVYLAAHKDTVLAPRNAAPRVGFINLVDKQGRGLGYRLNYHGKTIGCYNDVTTALQALRGLSK